jgi:hypothetical protein
VHQVAQTVDEDGVLEMQAGGAEQVAVEGICLAGLTVDGHGFRLAKGDGDGDALDNVTDDVAGEKLYSEIIDLLDMCIKCFM